VPSRSPVVTDICLWDAARHALWLNMPFKEGALTGDFYTEEFKMNKTVPSDSGVPHLWKYASRTKTSGNSLKLSSCLRKKVHALILDFEKWLFADEKKERD
jgi:hypothetical protein